MPMWAGGDCGERGVLRLRRVNRFAFHSAPLRMRKLWIVFGIILLWGSSISATTYYVSSSSGNDANPGSQAQPFQTLAKVNGLALVPGDIVFLKRGDVWNEQLIPPASGTSTSPITFDAYGSGAAPVLAPVISLSGATWTHNSGNIYTTPLTTAIASPQINNLQVGNFWGRRRSPNPGCATAGVIAGPGDFCLVYPTLYVYSPNGTLPSSYYGAITAVVGQASGLAVISIVNTNWLVFQHIKVQTFDYMGVSVSGTSDNLVFANMESDGMVPYGTTPHGFYVSAPNATSIQFLNDDAHLNYDGFHVDAATAVTVMNCRGYANRDAGLKDNSGHVTYSYSHFYGNNNAQFATSDVVGGIAGSGNVSSLIPPVVNNFKTYPARFSFTVDDVGSAPGTEAYINTFLTSPSGPYYQRPGLKFNAAVVPSYSVDWASVNGWYAGGNEIDSHSWSHQYYTTNPNPCGTAPCSPPYPNAPAMNIQYTGPGTGAVLTISGNTLSTSVTGASGDNISLDLTAAPYNTRQGLHDYLAGLAHYAVSDSSTPLARPNTHTVNLLSVTNQDIKSAAFALLYDQTKLVPDEMASSKSALQTNVPGLTESFYVYPDGIEDPSTEADAVVAGYTAARGSLAMKGQDNTTGTANSTYSNGINVQNITSLAAIGIHGMSQAQVNQIVASLIFRASAWGVPYGFFTHYNSRSDNTPDISNTELGYLLDAVTANGGMWMTNMGLAGVITSGIQVNGTTRYAQNPTGGTANFAVAGANSATVGRGKTTSYSVDLTGMDRMTLGTWDVGASAYVSQRFGAEVGPGNTVVGWSSSGAPVMTFAPGLLGGMEATITNTNSAVTVNCVTMDGSVPATNHDGSTCANGFASLLSQGGGFFSLTQPATVKIVSGAKSTADSVVSSYALTIPQPIITATHFGFQCGAWSDCAGANGAIAWPSYAALPKLMRLHDSRTAWPWVQYIGTATASGNTLTWVSGTQFIVPPGQNGSTWVGQTVAYNGSTYTITAVASATQMTVSPSIGTQATALPFTVTNWQYVDDYVDAIASNPGMMGMETFTLFPCGSAPSTTHCGDNGQFPNGTSTPPADFSSSAGSPSYNAFVTALVNHQTVGGHNVRDYVKVWELQNEWDLPVHLTDCGNMTACGTLLYQMVTPIAAIIRRNVPGAVILAPSATPASSTYKADYGGWLSAENTQGRISDFPNWHLYLSGGAGTTNTPEVQWATYVSATGTLLPIQNAATGWSLTGWTDTETNFTGNGYACSSQYTESDCAGQIARWQILHDSNGCLSLDWYRFVTTIPNGPSTPVSYGSVYQNLETLLAGGYFTAPAASDGNSPATWTAPFVQANGHVGLWVWTDGEAGKAYTVPGAFSTYQDLMGGSGAASGGITITTMPMLLE